MKAGNVIGVYKKAGHENEILERVEAGLVLAGWEVKSLREKKVSFDGSFVRFNEKGAVIEGLTITPLGSAFLDGRNEPGRSVQLLLNRREINRLKGKVDERGLTIVPLKMYWKNGKAKMEIGLARGKKLHNKKQAQKERDISRDQARDMKNF